jgi:hypothetical protein
VWLRPQIMSLAVCSTRRSAKAKADQIRVADGNKAGS